MKIGFYHEIDNDPEPEEVGTIIVTARIYGEGDNEDKVYSTDSLAKDFFEDGCKSKQDLNYFLLEAGVNEDDVSDALMKLTLYVDEVTCDASNEYSPEFALDVKLDLTPEDDDYYDDDEIVEDDDDDDDQIEEDDDEIEEAMQASLAEAFSIKFRPASKLVVNSLMRKVYNKNIQKGKERIKKNMKINLEECRICLEEFSDGAKVLTLPCGHDFDDECIVKWFETSHVCPLCRYELPCEDP